MSELDPYLNSTAINESSLEPYLPTVPLIYSERGVKSTAVLRSITKAKKYSTSLEPLIEANNIYFEERKKQEADMRQEATKEYLDEGQSAINESIAVMPPNDQEDMNAIADVEEILVKEGYHPNRVERSFIETMSPLAAKDYIERHADLLAIKNDMAASVEGTSLGGLVADIGKMLVVSDQSFISAEVANTSWLNSAQGIVERAKEINAIADRDERRKAIKEYIQSVESATGNVLQQTDLKDILLNPESRVLEESLDKASAIFDAITVAGVASTFVPAALGGVVGRAITSMAEVAGTADRLFSVIRDVNPIKMAAKAGNVNDAAKMSAVAARDEQVADALDVAQDVAATNGLPYSFEGMLEGATDGLSLKVREFNAQLDAAKGFVKNGIIKEDLQLTDKERELFQQRVIENLSKEDDVIDVRPLKSTEDGMEFEVHYSKNGEADASRIVKMKWDETDVVQGFKVVDEGLGQAKGFFASPNVKFALDRFRLVLPAIRTQYQQGRLRALSDTLYKDAIKPLGSKFSKGFKKSKEKVDKVLIYGDEYYGGGAEAGKVFTYKELTTGIRLPDGELIKLTPKEAESYYKQRMVWDFHHFTEDARLVEEAKRRGVQVVNLNGVKKLATPYDSPEKARLAVGDNHVFDPRKGTVSELSKDAIEEAYNSGFVLAKTDQYDEVVKGNFTKWRLVPTEDVKGFPKTMLNYREGHVTKITDDGVFVVKKPKVGKVNGKDVVVSEKTLGLFTSRKAAEAFVKKSIKQDVEELISQGLSEEEALTKAESNYKLLRDREVGEEDSLSDPLLFGSSPYTGKRAEEAPFLDEEGNKPVRINAYESLQRALTHSSNAYPMSTLKHNLQTRWLASAKPFLPHEYRHDFNQAIHHLSPDPNSDTYRALVQTHSYIRHVIGMPSDATIKTRKSIQRLADKLEERGFDRVAKFLNTKINHNDPTSVAKTITFHSLLGGFNLSQFIVQGLGATVAMSIDPKNFAKATKLSFAMNALDQASSPKAYQATLKFLSKSKLFKEGELEHVYDAWKKSGLRDDLLTSADYSEFSRGWEMTNAMLEAGTLPFRMGEAAMRRYTFASAYVSHVTDYSKPLTKEMFRDIMNRQTDLSLNMSRMNKASWQEGSILSVATQFKQITAKYLEAILGGQFSTEEKVRLMLGQFALFGMHGLPAGQTMNKVLQGYSQWNEDEMSPEIHRFINEGFTRWAMDAVGLDDINIINRVALGDSLDDLFSSISSDSLLEFLGGPFYSHVIDGTVESVKKSVELLSYLTGDHTFSSKAKMTQDFAKRVASAIPIVDDLETASFMYMRGLQLDSKGRVVATEDERNFSFAEVIAIAAGFGDRAGTDLYNSKMLRRKTQERLNEAADRIAEYIRKNERGLDNPDVRDIANFHAKLNALNEDEERIIWNRVMDRMKSDSRLQKEKEAFFNLFFKQGAAVKGSPTSELQLQVKEQVNEIRNQ